MDVRVTLLLVLLSCGYNQGSTAVIISESHVAKNMTLSTLYISERSMILVCTVVNSTNCPTIVDVVFKRNNQSIVYLHDCDGTKSMVSKDSGYYKCGCFEQTMRKTFLLITDVRVLDLTIWSCGSRNGKQEEICSSQELQFEQPVKPVVKENNVIFCEHSPPYLSIILFFAGLVTGFVLLSIILLVRVYFKNTEATLCFRKSMILEDTGLHRTEKLSLLGASAISHTPHSTRGEVNKLHKSTVEMVTIAMKELKTFQEVLLKVTDKVPLLVLDAIEETISNVPEWCFCNRCKHMTTEDENRCCNKKSCISLTEEFEDKFLNAEVLDKVLNGSKPGKEKELLKMRRVSAYILCDEWMHGHVGSKHRVVAIPSCCVARIRGTFPDANNYYTGLRGVREMAKEKGYM